MSRRKKKKSNGIYIILIIIVLCIGVYLIYNNLNKDDNNKKIKIINNIEEKNEKKNYDFKGKNIACDNLISIDNEAIYINDGNIYYVVYENEIYNEYKLATKGKGIDKIDNTLVGYVTKDSDIDTNYATKVSGKDYVIYNRPKKEESVSNVTDTSNYFKEYEQDSELVLRGGGYAGASNKAVSLKNGIAYFLRFNGDDLVSSEKIATNVKKIANIGDSHDKIIVVYIESDTILEEKYKDYDIIEDDEGKKCIKIC